MAEDMSRRGFLAGLTVGGTALALEARGADAVVTGVVTPSAVNGYGPPPLVLYSRRWTSGP